MLRNLFTLCISACLLVWLSVEARAQSITSGDVTGTITDPSGAGVPNAAVTLTNTNTNTTQNTTTNPQGTYPFALPQPVAVGYPRQRVGLPASNRSRRPGLW